MAPKLLKSYKSYVLFICLTLLLYLFIFNFTHSGGIQKGIQKLELWKGTDLLDNMDIDCNGLIRGDKNSSSLKLELENVERQLMLSVNRCQTLKTLFHFPSEPQSPEEHDYPLAYGLLVFQNLPQVLFMLSSIYHPQNQYCIAVSQNADSRFRQLLGDLTGCFPNVYFMVRPPISWGSHEIIESVYECLDFLSHLKVDWRYFQYLSGVDAPLKTNLEIVRMFKAMAGSANVEVKDYQMGRLKGKNYSSSPLPLYKSSLSALIPREAANAMASSPIPRALLSFLKDTAIADEAFWGTLLANKDLFDIPGSIRGQDLLDLRIQMKDQNASEFRDFYYMSRDQIWDSSMCKSGRMPSGSCAFGIGDLPRLLNSRAPIAHKFYLDTEPEAYFCVLKAIRRRSDNGGDKEIDVSFYQSQPQTQLMKGKSFKEIENLQRFL